MLIHARRRQPGCLAPPPLAPASHTALSVCFCHGCGACQPLSASTPTPFILALCLSIGRAPSLQAGLMAAQPSVLATYRLGLDTGRHSVALPHSPSSIQHGLRTDERPDWRVQCCRLVHVLFPLLQQHGQGPKLRRRKQYFLPGDVATCATLGHNVWEKVPWLSSAGGTSSPFSCFRPRLPLAYYTCMPQIISVFLYTLRALTRARSSNTAYISSCSARHLFFDSAHRLRRNGNSVCKTMAME